MFFGVFFGAEGAENADFELFSAPKAPKTLILSFFRRRRRRKFFLTPKTTDRLRGGGGVKRGRGGFEKWVGGVQGG